MSWIKPTKSEWRAWTLANKFTYAGMWILAVGVIVPIFLTLFGGSTTASNSGNTATNSHGAALQSQSFGSNSPVQQNQIDGDNGTIDNRRIEINAPSNSGNIRIDQSTGKSVLLDVLQGTSVTRNQLEDAFPYGYVVIWKAEGESLRWDVAPDSGIDWKADAESARLELQSMGELSRLTISGLEGIFMVRGYRIQYRGNSVGHIVKADSRTLYADKLMSIKLPENKRMMAWFWILRANERKLIVAIGCRIDDASKFHAPAPGL